ncbi:MAG: class I SAM-dependent methyltransferase [Ignavibacteria bacterium]
MFKNFFIRRINSGKKYWKNRVKNYGEKAVINLNHGLSDYSDITEHQKKEIFPILKQLLNGDEHFILDFGCGPGRFTSDLAKIIKGLAIGVDIIPELLKMAPKSESVVYKLMKEGKIPLKDKSVDIVWICLVLGGIKKKLLQKTVREIERISKDNSLIFLVENTSLKPNSSYWFFRTYDEYKKLFPSFKIDYLHEYYDFDERISIMGGRKID